MGYGHLGDGNLHVNIVKSKDSKYTEEELSDTLAMIEPWIFEKIQQVKGSISAEHGLGRAKNEYIHYSKPKEAVEMMKHIKTVFDPNHIMNPYKFLPSH